MPPRWQKRRSAYLMEKLGYQPPQPVESSVQAVPPAMLEAVKKVTYHAHRGTLKFMLEKALTPTRQKPSSV